MALKTPFEEHQTWGGHSPILHALCMWAQPRVVVECGCGRYSTPILAGHARRLHIVEHDAAWMAQVREKLPIDRDISGTMIPTFGLNNGTARHEITPEQRQQLAEAYDTTASLISQLSPRIDIAFIDTFTAARVPAVQAFAPMADIVVIHDTEGAHPNGYRLGECDGVLADLWHYSYRPEGATPEWHAFTWTDIFSRQPLDVRRIAALADHHAIALWGRPAPLVTVGRGPTGWGA